MRLQDTRFFNKNAKTKRATISGGKRGARVEYLTHIDASPVEPIDPELQNRLMISSAASILQTYISDGDLDIKRNDTIVIDNTEYVIKGIEPWDGTFRFGMSNFMLLAIEEVVT